MADQRSAEALAYRALYKTIEWFKLRSAQLKRKPYCERSIHNDRVKATTVNHRKPHRGDRKLFFDPANLESVCKPCHDGPIQREERRGYSPSVDAGGWPTDPKHPGNKVH